MLKKGSNACYQTFCIRGASPVRLPTDTVVSLKTASWRPRLGEIITVQNMEGDNFRARVFAISESRCNVHIFEQLPKNMESGLDILLLQALPDRERMEWIIQKATELGVKTIAPFFSKRSITLEEREKGQPKAHRWPFIAQKAAKQCRRGNAPVIAPYTGFKEALQMSEYYDIKILLWERARDSGIHSKFPDDIQSRRVCLLVGPEGGFAEEEINMAKETGFIPIGLGPRILRTETAAIAMIAVIQYRWGDMG
ncbi:16S rRNA (uracil(1498)-N(3))-methyltransferase [bacterium]|nr:16S rRNA (uracil(1498)-N(3))-methyltransferase [bacterium]